MAEDWKTRMSFNVDELFETQAEKDNGVIENVRLDEIIPFKGHTFKVIDNQEMYELAETVSQNGVIIPAVVFYNEEGQLEMISGHRRKRASEIAGKETIPVIIKKIDRAEATIIMGITNLQQRENILFSEKAFTYKAMYDAIKQVAGRPKNNYGQLDHNFKARKIIAEKVDTSEKQIDRYIRLTYLIPELLELVDEKIMAFNPAVDISYLDHINQKFIYDYYKDTEVCDGKGKIICKGVLPSLAQAKEFKQLYKEGGLDEDVIAEILGEPKPNQKEKIVFKDERMFKYMGDLTPAEFEKKVIKALDFYERHNKRVNENVGLER